MSSDEAKPTVQSETRLSDLAIRILKALEDGEWHDQEDVIEKVQYLIPPGEAFRIGESISVGKNRSMDDIIQSGRRARTVTMINNLLANNRIQRVGEKGRGKPKSLRVTRSVQNVYVVRDRNDNLKVYYQQHPDVVIHVIDQWARSDDPERDSKHIKEVFETIPLRFPNREEVVDACKGLMNRLNVDATLRQLSTDPSVTPVDYRDSGNE